MYPRHGGRFTGEPAYFKHISTVSKKLMEATGTEPSDFDYAIFHQPNGKFPSRIAKSMGFTPDQIKTGLLCPKIGNTYSGAVPLGLCAVLDEAEPGQRILATAYGSGAGSDSFDILVTDEMLKVRERGLQTVWDMIGETSFVDYATYAKMRGKILLGVRG